MATVQYLKGPGYVYDLLYMCIVYFNKDFILSHHLNFSKSTEDTEFFMGLLTRFGPVPDALLPFFRVKKNGRSFITTHYLFPYVESVPNKFDANYFFKELFDHDKLMDCLLAFYFPNLSNTEIQSHKGDLPFWMYQLDNSEYDDAVKYKLCGCLVNPSVVFQCLEEELLRKEKLLAEYYEQNSVLLRNTIDNFDYPKIATDFIQFKNYSWDINHYPIVKISICLVNKNSVYYVTNNENSISFLMGVDYLDMIALMKTQKLSPSLKEFGEVVSEQNRIDILNLLIEKKEITVKDLERSLKFSGSTAYYHLTMMLKVNMVKSRNRGRLMLYSLNFSYFEALSKTLENYGKEEKQK